MIKSVLSVLFFFLITSQAVLSHGVHYEVQLKSELQVNDKKQLSAIKMTWLYDQEASKDLLKDQADLGILAKQLISDLERFYFFTQFEVGDRVLITSKVQDFDLKLLNVGDSSLLELTFTVPIKSKVEINSIKQIQFNHADPTEMAIFYYDKPLDIVLADELKQNCSAKVVEKTEFAEGEFPQIVTVNCM
ncbi:DUF1007 family protein [Algibacter sp.]|uniref:DUF1007 family protein n=1 Tax=Algibacter sp. TaxID=1872428 RepID=UPI003C791E24